MVKVALFLSGQPRFVNSISYKYIKQNILDKYDCDVFCHTWYDPTEILSTSSWSGLNGYKCRGDEIELIKQCYNPKVFTYDKPLREEQIDKSHFKNVENIGTPYNLTSMYTSMKRCFKNFLTYHNENETTSKYDVYIRCRFDVIPTILPDFSTLDQNMTYFVHHHGDRPVLVNNLILSTSYHAISKLMNVMDELNSIGDKGVKINDEDVIYELITYNHIPHKKISRLYFKDVLPVEINFNMYDLNQKINFL